MRAANENFCYNGFHLPLETTFSYRDGKILVRFVHQPWCFFFFFLILSTSNHLQSTVNFRLFFNMAVDKVNITVTIESHFFLKSFSTHNFCEAKRKNIINSCPEEIFSRVPEEFLFRKQEQLKRISTNRNFSLL